MCYLKTSTGQLLANIKIKNTRVQMIDKQNNIKIIYKLPNINTWKTSLFLCYIEPGVELAVNQPGTHALIQGKTGTQLVLQL